MIKCKRCNKRVPDSHKGEWGEHDCMCRKCWHIKHSKYKNLKNKQSDLQKEEEK